MTQLHTCTDLEAVATLAAREAAGSIARAIVDAGVAHIGLSGGHTPTRAYQLLAPTLQSPTTGAIHVWFADERCVPPDDERSNYLLAQRAMLADAALPAEQVHRMQGELGPHDGAAHYAQELRAHFPQQAHPVLDLIVLGIGPDGHVASLFPNAPTLAATAQASCYGVDDSPKPPPQRITLSLPVLRAAKSCLLIATGQEKSEAIAQALDEPTTNVPASLLNRDRLTIIVDEQAAGRL